MVIGIFAFSAILLAGCATVDNAAKVADAGKNVFNVKYGAVTAVPENEWDFNFRAYRASSEWLVSDPAVRRDVTSGNATEKNATALHVSCDAEGFTLRVLCAAKQLKTYLSSTNDFPSPTLEMYVTADDEDDERIAPHYMTSGPMADMREFPDKTNDRFYRQVRPFMTCSEETYGEGAILCKIRYDWAAFFDELPIFKDKRDNFWRLSVIRWIDGGQTWGGPVHQKSLAGYIRWPCFTEAQKDEISKATLRKAWIKFSGEISRPDLAHDRFPYPPTDWNLGWVTNEFAKIGRTSPNYNEDLAFRKRLAEMTAKGKAYGGDIAKFDSLDAEAKRKFYLEAAEYLFNFRLHVEEEYRKCQENLVFERN